MTDAIDTSENTVRRQVDMLRAMAQSGRYPGAPLLRALAASHEALLAERDRWYVDAELQRIANITLTAERDAALAEAARLREALHGLITTLWVDGPNAENIINADALTNARLALAKETNHG